MIVVARRSLEPRDQQLDQTTPDPETTHSSKIRSKTVTLAYQKHVTPSRGWEGVATVSGSRPRIQSAYRFVFTLLKRTRR